MFNLIWFIASEEIEIESDPRIFKSFDQLEARREAR